MTLETKRCEDCHLELPLKQFATYLGKRHPLCRTCLALDVADFKEWALPYVEKRRAEGPPERGYEDWEIAVWERKELSNEKKSALLCRSRAQTSRKPHRQHRKPRILTRELVRPWKAA